MMVTKSTREVRSVVEAFLESHVFDGGRKVHAYMLTAQRPDWAPSAEWVGFESDFKLLEGEKVVEFAKFAINSSLVCWIAVWVKSTDRTFGDRQNYEGLGIWLRDVVITSPGPLIESLERLGSLLGQSGEGDLADKSLIFLRDAYPDRYAQHCDSLPEELAGWRPATAPGSAKKNYEVAAEFSEALILISDLLLSAQFLNKPGDAHSRCFIRISPNTKSIPGDHGASAVELLTSTGFAAGIASLLPQACGSINRNLEALTARERDCCNQIARLQEEIENQGEVNRKIQLQLTAAEDRAKSFELALSKDGEQQRFVRLFDAVSDVRSRIAAQSGIETRLSAEIRRALKLELAPIAELERRIETLAKVSRDQRVSDSRPRDGTFYKEDLVKWSKFDYILASIFASFVLILIVIVYFARSVI